MHGTRPHGAERNIDHSPMRGEGRRRTVQAEDETAFSRVRDAEKALAFGCSPPPAIYSRTASVFSRSRSSEIPSRVGKGRPAVGGPGLGCPTGLYAHPQSTKSFSAAGRDRHCADAARRPVRQRSVHAPSCTQHVRSQRRLSSVQPMTFAGGSLGRRPRVVKKGRTAMVRPFLTISARRLRVLTPSCPVCASPYAATAAAPGTMRRTHAVATAGDAAPRPAFADRAATRV
jgi:hypothetical protein